MMISYAQNFEDVLLWRCLRDIPNGVYVDVGAHDPELDSVTRWFYDQGWSGINLEPVPHLFERFQVSRPRDRNLAVAAGAKAGRAVLRVFPDSPGLSTTNINVAEASQMQGEDLEIEVLPLREIFAPLENQPIHFLKIDVEGAERNVLEGMDFQRFRPWVVVIEAAPPEGIGPTGPAWDDLILPFGYREAWSDGLNRYFVAEEHAERIPRLAMPPNVFDRFELAVTLRERAARLEAEAMQHDLHAAVTLRDERVRDLDVRVKVRDARVVELSAAVVARDSRIAELEAAIVTRDSRIGELDATVLARNSRAAELEAAIAARETHIEELQKLTTSLQQQHAFHLEAIALMREEISGWRARVEATDTEMQRARIEAQEARAMVTAYERSYSWRAMGPVRRCTGLARRIIINLRSRWGASLQRRKGPSASA
ncbi:FkbM family methyltransferase [Roseomonas sp. GCM10028921]